MIHTLVELRVLDVRTPPGGAAMTTLIGSVVIPAHNEAATIAGCLGQLRGAIASGELETVVVSNGSSDRTVEVARELLDRSPCSLVVDLPQASKAAALRAGDDAASSYPRVYLDADVTVDEDTVRQAISVLGARTGPAVAAPRLVVDTSGSSVVVKAYHRAWARLPYAAGTVIGTGFYAVNAAAGDRLGAFPDLLNDDEWVRRQFSADETVASPGTFTVRATRTARALVRQRARTEIGNRALWETESGRDTTWSDLGRLAAGSPRAAADVLAYVAVTAGVRVVVRWRTVRGTTSTWATDTTTRQPSEPV